MNLALGPLAIALRPRTLRVALVLALLAFLAAVAGVVWGDYPLTPDRILATLTGSGERMENFVLWSLRIPRLLTGLAAGAAFGVAGALFQSIARNALASPDVVGFNAGAALGAVAVIVLLDSGGIGVTAGAIAGGLATAIVVGALSWRRGLPPERLVLVGIGVGLTLYAVSDLLLIRSDIFDAAEAAAWLTGSLNASGWDEAARGGVAVLIALVAALALSRPLDALAMGEDTGRGLGIAVTPVKGWAIFIGVVLAAMATSVAGPVPFVSLLAGPVARYLIGRGGAALFTAALVGALILTLADLAGRLLFAPMQLPAGLFTAAAGAPVLLWLMWRRPRQG